ncbi:WD40 repeat-like protein, partial [Exidia glandulosa HHB12029]
DGQARLWDTRTGRSVGRPIVNPAPVVSIVLSADSERAAMVCDDGSIHTWNTLGSCLPLQPIVTETPAVRVLCFSNMDRINYKLASWDGSSVRVWDVTTGKCIFATKYPGASGTCPAVALSPDGTRMAAGDRDVVSIFTLASTEQPLELAGHTQTVTALAFSPDGRLLGSGSEDKTLRVWNVETGESTLPPIPHESAPKQIIFSNDGSTVVTASRDGYIRQIDATTEWLRYD